jgi:hypothetical protein
MEAHRQGVNDFDLRHATPKLARPCATIALKAKLDVVAGHGVPVVEREPAPQLELVDEPVLTLHPRFGQAAGHLFPRKRAEQRVVDRVEHAEGRDLRRRGGRIEPGRCEGDMEGDRNLAWKETATSPAGACARDDSVPGESREAATTNPMARTSRMATLIAVGLDRRHFAR